MHYFFLLLTFFSIITHAAPEEIFPSHCKPFVLHGESSTLSAGTPRVFMLHNLSDFDLWITQQTANSADLTGRLQSNHWSALVLDKHAFTFNCIESKPGHEQAVSCEKTLAACEWTPQSLPKNKYPVFWAAEDMTLPPLIAYLQRLGFELPQTV
jgi:hypothetical protein